MSPSTEHNQSYTDSTPWWSQDCNDLYGYHSSTYAGCNNKVACHIYLSYSYARVYIDVCTWTIPVPQFPNSCRWCCNQEFEWLASKSGSIGVRSVELKNAGL